MRPCEPVIFAVVVLPRHTRPALAAKVVAHGCAFALMRHDTVACQAVACSADGARGLYEFLSHKPLLMLMDACSVRRQLRKSADRAHPRAL